MQVLANAHCHTQQITAVTQIGIGHTNSSKYMFSPFHSQDMQAGGLALGRERAGRREGWSVAEKKILDK